MKLDFKRNPISLSLGSNLKFVLNYILIGVVITQLFVIIGLLSRKSRFICMRSPMSGAVICEQKK